MHRFAAILVAFAVALAAGCGGSPDSPGFDRSVRVIEEGSAPDLQLRYVPQESEPVALEVSIGGAWVFDIDRQVTRTGDGTFTVETTVRDFRFDASDLPGNEDIPEEDLAVPEEVVDQQRDGVRASSMTERIATDGLVLDRDIEAPDSSSEQLMTLLAQQLELFAPVFPLDPIGDGAQWAQEFGLPDLFVTGDQVAALMSIERTSERFVSEPERPIDLRLRIAGPTQDTDFSVSRLDFPPPRVVNVTGAGQVTIDPVTTVSTGVITYRTTAEKIRLNKALTREPFGIVDPVRVTISPG